jgi:hypothetical protein
MRLLNLAFQVLLVGFVAGQTLSTSTNSLNSSASAASESSVTASETSTVNTDNRHGSTTNTNPVSVTQTAFGHQSETSATLSSVAPASSTAGNGHQSASQLGTSTVASPKPTGSSNGNRAIVVEDTGVVVAAVAFVMALM